MQQHAQTSVKTTSSPGDAETDKDTMSHGSFSGSIGLSHSQLLRPLFLKNMSQPVCLLITKEEVGINVFRSVSME